MNLYSITLCSCKFKNNLVVLFQGRVVLNQFSSPAGSFSGEVIFLQGTTYHSKLFQCLVNILGLVWFQLVVLTDFSKSVPAYSIRLTPVCRFYT